MMILRSLVRLRTAALTGGMLVLGLAGAAAAQAQTAPERGVFITQIGDASRADIVQHNPESFARVVQDGTGNTVDLDQKGDAAHRAQIGQDGDDNHVDAGQNGDGPTELTLLQEGNGNTALVAQRETAPDAFSRAAILQRGNGNSVVLVQDGSDNLASLTQTGNGNTMTATQLDSGNRLQWIQDGDGLPDLQITQNGGASIQITQSNTGAQFVPPPGSGG